MQTVAKEVILTLEDVDAEPAVAEFVIAVYPVCKDHSLEHALHIEAPHNQVLSHFQTRVRDVLKVQWPLVATATEHVAGPERQTAVGLLWLVSGDGAFCVAREDRHFGL